VPVLLFVRALLEVLGLFLCQLGVEVAALTLSHVYPLVLRLLTFPGGVGGACSGCVLSAVVWCRALVARRSAAGLCLGWCVLSWWFLAGFGGVVCVVGVRVVSVCALGAVRSFGFFLGAGVSAGWGVGFHLGWVLLAVVFPRSARQHFAGGGSGSLGLFQTPFLR